MPLDVGTQPGTNQPGASGFIVAGGLLEQKHIIAMRPTGVVVFLWLLREQTGAGIVRAGAPVRAVDIATEVGWTTHLVRRCIQRLITSGYLTAEIVRGHGGGYRIQVQKPKRWPKVAAQMPTQMPGRKANAAAPEIPGKGSKAFYLKPDSKEAVQPSCTAVAVRSTTNSHPPTATQPTDFQLTSQTATDPPPRRAASAVTRIADRFAAYYRDVIAQPYLTNPARDNALIARALRAFASKPDPEDALLLRLEVFWREKRRHLAGERDAHWCGRAKPTIPGWLGQIPSIDEAFAFRDAERRIQP